MEDIEEIDYSLEDEVEDVAEHVSETLWDNVCKRYEDNPHILQNMNIGLKFEIEQLLLSYYDISKL